MRYGDLSASTAEVDQPNAGEGREFQGSKEEEEEDEEEDEEGGGKQAKFFVVMARRRRGRGRGCLLGFSSNPYPQQLQQKG
jgi:hypothetical protein